MIESHIGIYIPRSCKLSQVTSQTLERESIICHGGWQLSKPFGTESVQERSSKAWNENRRSRNYALSRIESSKIRKSRDYLQLKNPTFQSFFPLLSLSLHFIKITERIINRQIFHVCLRIQESHRSVGHIGVREENRAVSGFAASTGGVSLSLPRWLMRVTFVSDSR